MPDFPRMDERAVPTAYTVADLVTRAAERAPDRIALIAGPATLTWAELDGQVDRAASALRELGLVPGDRIVLQLGNSVDFPVLYCGALRAGLVAVPANTGYTGPELADLLTDSGAVALATSSVHVISAAGELRTGALRHVLVAAPSGPDGTLPLPGLLAGAPPLAFRHVPRSPEDLAVLGYTSGTSGRPRGAMLSHRALLANLEQCAALRPEPVTAEDVLLLAIPLFHAYGLNPGLGLLARAGATGVLVEHFDPAGTLELIRRHGGHRRPRRPGHVRALGRGTRPARGVRRRPAGHLGRGPAAAAHAAGPRRGRRDRVRGVRPDRDRAGADLDAGRRRAQARLGRPAGARGRAVRRRDETGAEPDDDGAGPGEVDLVGADGGPGEIAVPGRNLFSGYWPDGVDGPDAEGWWLTVDVAYADDEGDLHLVDRRTDLILVSGFNVYPAEVEAVLAAHPAVAEAAVLGRPDPARGDETVLAYVVAAAGTAPTQQELLDWAARSLARFKLPAAIEFLPELPHSPTGKVSKARLRADQLR